MVTQVDVERTVYRDVMYGEWTGTWLSRSFYRIWYNVLGADRGARRSALPNYLLTGVPAAVNRMGGVSGSKCAKRSFSLWTSSANGTPIGRLPFWGCSDSGPPSQASYHLVNPRSGTA